MRSRKPRRWFRSSGIRGAAAYVTTLAVVAGLTTATAPPAFAVDNGVSDLLQVLGADGGDDNLAQWTAGLESIGKLGEQLPLISASPGGLLGYSDLFQKAVTDELEQAAIDGGGDFGDLAVDKNIDIGGGRTGHLTTTVSDADGGQRLNIAVTVNKTATGQDMHVTGDGADLTISDGITVGIKSRLALSLVWTGSTDDQVYVVSGADGPRLDLDAYGSIDTAAAEAAFGILGVSLTDSTLDLKAHFVGKVNDPNNDGKLFFTGGPDGDNELAPGGSLEGLFEVKFDPEGSKPIDNDHPDTPGSMTATFQLGATDASDDVALPDGINATITVGWPDISTGTPTVEAPGIGDTIGKFANMSLNDLASSLAQLIAAITAMQKAKFDPDAGGPLPEIGDLDLPFMRGKLSDAVQVGSTLKDFLAANTVPAPGQPGFIEDGENATDPAQAGQPKFTSLQDLLDLLEQHTEIAVSEVQWNTAQSKLLFTLGIDRNPPGTAVDLDELSAVASGPSATYDVNKLTVSGTPWEDITWVGHRVTAGTSAGEVLSNTENSITLKTDWIGGKPTDDTPFVIHGSEAHPGAVTFANNLDNGSGQGIVNANADQTFATVKPSYEATLNLVLDLRNPVSGAGCATFEDNTEACPFTKSDGPFNSEISSLPLNTDRLMVRTGSNLFEANMPITTGVDLTANAGFFKVRLKGDLAMCASSQTDTCTGDATDPMLSVGLKEMGDAQHDIRLSTLFKKLTEDPKSLLGLDLNVRGYADVTVSVPDADSFLPGGASAKFTAKWADLTQTSGTDGPQFALSDLSEIFGLDFDASDPNALFTLLIKTLQTVSKQLASANTTAGSGVFGTEIPGLGKSLRDLLLSDESNAGSTVTFGSNFVKDSSRTGDAKFENLEGRTVVVGTQVGVVKEIQDDGTKLVLTKNWDAAPANGAAYAMRSALDDATDRLLAFPPDNIQDSVEVLNDVLGGDMVQFRYLESGGKPNLVLDLNWARDYRTASPLRLDVGGGKTFAAVEGAAMAKANVSGAIDIGLVIPLEPSAGPANGDQLKVLADSAIGINTDAALTNGVVKGTVGPLSVSLGNPANGAPAAELAQAKADLSLALADNGAAADTPVSFNQFFSNVDVAFNNSNGTVDCGEGLTTDLMVCAKLPLYVNGVASDAIKLRIPDSTNPAHLFDIGTNQELPEDSGEFELELPDFAALFASMVLDFTNLGDGIEGYLTKIEQAFRLASFDGKLPLVGDDLQQGADFIGKMRTELRKELWDKLPGGGSGSDANAVKKFINDNIDNVLANAGIKAADVEVGFSCNAVLEPVSPAPSVNPTKNPPPETDPPTPAPPSGNWQYRIVAFQNEGSAPSDTIPSATGSGNNYKNFAFGSSNLVSWTSVAGASGYKVLRKHPDETAFKLVATRTKSQLSYTDTNPGGGSAYEAVDVKPERDPCPSASVDGITLEFQASIGDVTLAQGCTNDGDDNKCLGKDIPLDIGIPGLALRQGDNSPGIGVKFGFQLRVNAGITRDDGFYLLTHDGWDGPGDNLPSPELQVGFNFDLPDEMVAELAFIRVKANKATGAGHDPTKPLFAGAFQVDITAGEDSCYDGAGPECAANDTKKLLFADITNKPVNQLFGVALGGAFHIDWILDAQFADNETQSAFPGVRANFQLDWDFGSHKELKDFGPPAIAFKDIQLSAGEFFTKVLGPVVKKMKQVTQPIQPVIDTLYAPIPVLSELSRAAGGDDVTLVTLAKAFSTIAGGPDLSFVDTIKAVIEFLNRMPTCTATNCYLPIGAFTLNGDTALNTANSPTTADKMYATKTNAQGNPMSSDGAAEGAALKQALNGKNATAGAPDVFGSGGNEGDVEKSGFSFPILDNPATAFNLLMGGDVTLVEFDSGPLTLGFSWRQDFGPVYAPPPVFVTLAGSASASLRIVAGLDTYGLRKAVEAVANGTKTTAIEVLDGLFFKTVDNNGKPIAVLTLTGEIAAGAAVSAVIIKVGIEGGLRLTIAFFWNDPNDDGKFRVSEFLHAALNNPACLFTMSGKLTLFLRVYITIGVSIFSVTFSFTLAEFTLLDFSVAPECEPPPPRLGGVTDDEETLIVFAGGLGQGERGHSAWSNEAEGYEEDTVKVLSLHYAQRPGDLQGENADFDGFEVQMLGEVRQYLNPNLKRVVVDGTGYGRTMLVSFTGDGKKEGNDEDGKAKEGAGDAPTVFDKIAVVIGSSNADTISTDAGRSYVDGRGGDDIIVTSDTGKTVGGIVSKASVAGGGHADTITVGNGDNRVAGDATLGTATVSKELTLHETDGDDPVTVSVIDWTQLAEDPTTKSGGSDQGDDVIGVGLGANKVRGNGGRDKIGVDADQPDPQNPGTPIPAGNNVLIGDGGSDNITGGTGNDKIFTGAQSEFGVDADGPADTDPPGEGETESTPAVNIADTGTGSDDVWGSQGIDLVTSHSKTTQTAKIRGGANNDVLVGGFGTDEIYGGPDDDWVFAEPAEASEAEAADFINGVSYGPKRSYTKLPLPPNTAPSEKLLVGGLGNDHIVGGDGKATIFGDKYLPAEKCAAANPVSSDPVAESSEGPPDGLDGNDFILGGAGIDTVSAGGADDIANVFGADDLVCGQEGNDTLRGGNHDDHLWGGSGNDLLYGEAGADKVFGNGGNDVAYGGADDDVIEGNNGSDWASGGSGNDAVFGGTRAAGRTDSGDDDLYGDTGADTLIGDNGSPTTLYPFDLDGATPTAGAGDRIHGGANNDKAYGGLGNDIVNGNDHDDYLEGNNGSDTIHGNAHEDRIIGGSSEEASAGVGRPDVGDVLFGDAGPDVIAGDNAKITLASDVDGITRVIRMREFALFHQVQLLDLGLTPTAGTSGADRISGGDDMDVAYGQGGPDRIKGDADDDYAEGGPGIDWIEGNAGDDDLVGGSSTVLSGSGEARSGQPDTADAVFGGPGDDVAIGDNGQVLRPLAGQDPTKATVRLGTEPGTRMAGRVVEQYDRQTGGSFLTAPDGNRFGADRMSGGAGVDVVYGQDGGDFLSGGTHDDYLEGNGGADVLRGDLGLGEASDFTTVAPLADPGWPGSASGPALLEGDTSPDGQDDMIGGSSTAGFRDGDDTMQGDGADDVQLGDNGTLVRTVAGPQGSATEKVYTERYPDGAVPSSATKSRVRDPDFGDVSTRFCTDAQATCEVANAFGDDTLFGNGGDDGMWGQDGNDTMHGNAGHDEMYGELGDDTMFGNDGDDAMLGDRGGVSMQHLDEGDDPAQFTVSMTQPPAETFTSFQRGTVANTRDSGMHKRVDLLHDVDGNVFVGASGDPAMAHAGLTEGGNDEIRGGNGFDQIHAGFGNDLANGDSGGDVLFGDDGDDVMWGGRGCDPVLDAATPDCQLNGAFDPHARGANDRFLDHSFGGQGADILDYNPRGSVDDPGTSCSNTDQPLTTGKGKNAVTVDPCSWFPMTNKDDDDLSNNQHHHGTDWMYGGWDRDVMQGNVSENGPNIGDRMIDWTGAYNLYTHCNAAYGGQNDIRLLAPDLVEFLAKLAWGDGAGQTAAEVSTAGQSAYRELAFTYQDDFQEHGIGPAFPGTPGHFDDPNACEA